MNDFKTTVKANELKAFFFCSCLCFFQLILFAVLKKDDFIRIIGLTHLCKRIIIDVLNVKVIIDVLNVKVIIDVLNVLTRSKFK